MGKRDYRLQVTGYRLQVADCRVHIVNLGMVCL